MHTALLVLQRDGSLEGSQIVYTQGGVSPLPCVPHKKKVKSGAFKTSISKKLQRLPRHHHSTSRICFNIFKMYLARTCIISTQRREIDSCWEADVYTPDPYSLLPDSAPSRVVLLRDQ